ncbi:MAG TPA: multicopper oxidase domain-containing protein [Hyphomicrobiaceae bacterium]|jgi:blue copper oxidase|nr:multicopper oxidase domain-containing protein [Hyphomicrobiaceae bacterium]
MSGRSALTRRQALMLSASATAGLVTAGLPRWALGAPAAAQPLPIPRLIEARSGEPVTLTLQKTQHRFLPGRAVPSHGISASYLSPVVRVRRGDTIPFRVENGLDEETTLHWHGMLVPSEVDGGPHNTIAPGATWSPEITVKQPAATTWFHPHPHRKTARQIYAGLAGMMIVSDGDDRDRGIPASYGVDDLPIVLQDKRFAGNGTATYDPDMMDIMHGFRGDTLIVNGAVSPVANVPAGFVRLRLLNAANARNFNLRFTDRRAFLVIASDGGYLPEAVEVTRLLIAPAERYEILVDFANGRPVDLVTMPEPNLGMGPGMMGPAPRSSFGIEHVMRFAPAAELKATITKPPGQLATIGAPDVQSAVKWRTFELDAMLGMGMMGMGMMGMRGGRGQMMGINGRSFAMDRTDVTAKLGTAEVWEISSGGMPMAHPFHIHGATFRILSKNGLNPPRHEAGWKDVVLVDEHAEVLVRFDHPAPRNMPFMYHCHILEHEDYGMMGQFAVV